MKTRIYEDATSGHACTYIVMRQEVMRRKREKPKIGAVQKECPRLDVRRRDRIPIARAMELRGRKKWEGGEKK